MSVVNRQFRLAARPVGLPTRSDWRLTEEPTPEPVAGEFLVKILYISLDPQQISAGSINAAVSALCFRRHYFALNCSNNSQ